MKTSLAIIGKLAAAIILSLILSTPSQAQQLQFTDVRVTSGGAIQLYWSSESNAVYSIEYASELTDSGTIWQTLYQDYPALGTNTFWTDAGDQNAQSVINHPRDGAMRFYRVVQTGTNDLANAPQVSIVSPTNNAVLTGDIEVSVSVTSSLTVNTIRLFVDGQEAGYQNDTETNFVINTCQFGNGSHKIFAVVESSTGSETTGESADFVENYGVSSAASVTFDNFITDYRGKLRFQDPDETETNRFSANFAAYADWTLTITNQDGVAVRTETGTGFGMEFVVGRNWRWRNEFAEWPLLGGSFRQRVELFNDGRLAAHDAAGH
jgi:Bacterial Ig domain